MEMYVNKFCEKFDFLCKLWYNESNQWYIEKIKNALLRAERG